jgi:hypothetical protein
MLSFYIKKCRELHNICFFQWRNMFPPKELPKAYDEIKFDAEDI